MKLFAHLVGVLHRSAKTLKMGDIVFSAAMADRHAPSGCLIPLDEEDTFDAGLVARAQAAVLVILTRCRHAQIANSIVGSISVYVIHLSIRR